MKKMKEYEKYERLTATDRNEDGSAYFGLFDVELLDKKNGVGDGVSLILDKLADLEDLEDDGKLLILPCNKENSKDVSNGLINIYNDFLKSKDINEITEKYIKYVDVLNHLMIKACKESK